MKIHPAIINTVERLIAHWDTRVVIGSGPNAGQTDVIKIQRGVFQGDSLSPLLFCMTLLALSVALRRGVGYMGGPPNNRGHKITHLFNVDDLKLYAANEKDLRNMMQIVSEFSNDVGMSLGIDKCAVCHVKSGKIDIAGDHLDLIDGTTVKYLTQDYTDLGIPQREINNIEKVRNQLKDS